MSEAIATIESRDNVECVIRRMDDIRDLMKRAMDKDVDYGVVPGTKSKPTLLKPGAEKLCVMFRFSPRYATEKTFHEGGHLTVESTCRIYDMHDHLLGESSAMCSTKESKYAWRNALRLCPKCGVPAIMKNKTGKSWQCIGGDKGGCWEKYAEDDAAITGQQTGRVQNPDIADSYNTVLRIAEKRALIAAVRLVTGSSSLFDEEMPQEEHHEAPTNGHAPKQEQPKQEPKTFLPPAKVQDVRHLLVDPRQNPPVREDDVVFWASNKRTRDMNELTSAEAESIEKEYAIPTEEDHAVANGWNEDLEKRYRTADDYNSAVAFLKDLTQTQKKLVRPLIKAHAAKHGLAFDNVAKVFVELQPAGAA